MRLDAALDVPLADVAATAQAAEAAGVAALWTTETKHDPFLPLSLAAAATERIELGTAVAVAFARSPVATASSAWDLARLSDGRFILGLGSQVRAHVEHRFGMPWPDRPVARMREYVQVVRAAWEAWQTGVRPSFRGEHYRFTLMTPFFDPGPIEHPMIPVYLAGVGAGMTRLAGEVADGLLVHPFHTRAWLEDVVRPAVTAGARAAGRNDADIRFAGSIIVATTAEEAREARRAIGFYASTPTYRPVLEHHGWGEIGDALSAHARRGRWDEMADTVTDEMLNACAVVADPADLRAAIERRASGLFDRVSPYAPYGTGPWTHLAP